MTIGCPLFLHTSEYRNYDYDSIGNRHQTIEDTVTRTYVPNALNQYYQITTDNGQQTTDKLTYDEDGNLTSILTQSSSVDYAYNAENRLIAVEPQTPSDGDKKVEFVYDYMGRSVKKGFYLLY